MARVVVVLAGDEAAAAEATRLLADGAAVVLVGHADLLGRAMATVPEGPDRGRFSAVAGDPGSDAALAAAVELAREIHGAVAPEVVDIT